VRRLIPNYREVERDYYDGRPLPIMHVSRSRTKLREVPWVPMNLYTALVRARDLAIERLRYNVGPAATIPWLWPPWRKTWR